MLSNFGSEKKSDSPLHFNFCFFKAHHCVFELHVTPFISGKLHLRIHGRIWGEGVFSTHFYFCSKDLFLLYFYVLNLLDILNIGIKCSFILTITITTCICYEEIQLSNCAKRIHTVSK